jgi:HSP20 family protein
MATMNKTEKKDEKNTGSDTLAAPPQQQQLSQRPQEQQRTRGLARQRRPSFGPLGLMRRLFEDLAQLSGSDTNEAQRAQDQGNDASDLMFVPRVDVAQQGDRLLVTVDLPGTAVDDVRVMIEDDAMIIEGERHDEREYQEGEVWRAERMYGRFQRVIPLPEGVDPETAEARFENGVLQIALKAPSQKSTGKQIDIKSGTQQQDKSREATSH